MRFLGFILSVAAFVGVLEVAEAIWGVDPTFGEVVVVIVAAFVSDVITDLFSDV